MHNTLLRGENTWAKIRSEATQPMCLRPSERLQQFVMRFCQENLELPAGVAEG